MPTGETELSPALIAAGKAYGLTEEQLRAANGIPIVAGARDKGATDLSPALIAAGKAYGLSEEQLRAANGIPKGR